MENKTNKSALDQFSQLILNTELPDLSIIKPIDYQTIRGTVGPFATDGTHYAFDLRKVSEKGSLGPLHPIELKARLLSEEMDNSSDYELTYSTNYHFLKALTDKFSLVSFTTDLPSNYEIYSYTDFLAKKNVSTESVILKDFLYSSNCNFFDLEVLDFIDSKTYYVDLGFNLYMQLSQDSQEQKNNLGNAFQSKILDSFLNFYDIILLNQGNGRISTINKLFSSQFRTLGLNIILDNEHSLGNKAILKSHGLILTIPTSITDALIKQLKQVLNE